MVRGEVSVPSAAAGEVVSILALVVIGLATWRVSSLFVNERGPWDIFVRLRDVIGFEHDDGEVIGAPATFWGGLFGCVWCLSLWVAPVMWGLYEVVDVLVLIIAAATVAVIVQRVVSK